MSLKLSIELLVTLLLVGTCVQYCKASFSVGGNSYNLGNAINVRLEPQQCQDISGRIVNHGSHYVPMTLDNCKMCVCDNGNPKSCRGILCQPPSGCRSFQMTSKCCEFQCLDKKDHEKSAFSTFQVISLILLCIALILFIIWCVWRRKLLKAELEKRIAEFKLKRNQQIVEEVSPTSPTTAFSEEKENKDLYVRMSVDMLRKSEVIDELKKKICVLEDKLDSDGEDTRRNSRNSEIILRSHEESWKNLYDLNVDYATIAD